MKCEQCQELISIYLDNELEPNVSINVQTHLSLCAECAKVCEDFAMILDFCEAEDILPNSKALWCRINNIIESDVKSEIHQENQQQRQPAETNWLSKAKSSFWQFSSSQVVASILGIALISSLLTVVGLKNFVAGEENYANAAPNVFEKVLGKVGLIATPQQTREKRIKEQQATIDYWRARVEARRANWEYHLREAFDRNLNEIDQVVYEYDKILLEDPDDELSGEMLDSALNEKVDLLREFSEL
ncbi:MAG: zf-HC2 domain-containing protein [Pyrinomonadaceae bacterium]